MADEAPALCPLREPRGWSRARGGAACLCGPAPLTGRVSAHVYVVACSADRRGGRGAREAEAPVAVVGGRGGGLHVAVRVGGHRLDGGVRAGARLAELQLHRLDGVAVVLAVLPVGAGQLA